MHIKKLGQKINIIRSILKFLPKFNAINDHFNLITNSWCTIKNNVHYLTYFFLLWWNKIISCLYFSNKIGRSWLNFSLKFFFELIISFSFLKKI